MAEHKVYTIDGKDFSNLSEFYEAISRTLIPGAAWGRNLDAFNDILRGGFGTPSEGFVLVWKNAEKSRQQLTETVGGRRAFDVIMEILAHHADKVTLRLE